MFLFKFIIWNMNMSKH